MRKGTVPTMRISVAKSKQWFFHPPKSVEKEFKNKHKYGFCVYSIKNEGKKLMKTIKETTRLMLDKK